jgi:hypothetical protein
VELHAGEVGRLLDLGKEWRGCDEAWHLQMAIDAEKGVPQQYRLSDLGPGKAALLEFFGPLPQWAQRRIDVVAERVRSPGTLLAYRLAREEADGLRPFLEENLWVQRRQS